MQKLQNLVQRKRRGCARFSFQIFIIAIEHWLGQFNKPIAERAPNKVIGCVCGFVEAEGFQ